MDYIKVIKTAVFVFPVLCLILTLPFLIFHYRKYGSVSFLRFLFVFSFFFYLLCCYFLVILPLPSIERVAHYTKAYYNLKLFFVVPEIAMSGEFNIIDPDTYVFLLNQKYIEPLFNILMTIPFGIYLRYYFKCGFFKTLFFSFLLSLFFELTQLSGLYFIYPRPYRLFDVNDLINNTSGGFIGYLIMPIFSLMLPKRDMIDSKDYLRGRVVSIGRMGVSVVIDYFFVSVICLILFNFVRFKIVCFLYVFISFFVFVIVPYLSSGYTFGKWLLNFRNVGSGFDGSVSFFKYVFRWLVIHVIVLNGWFVLLVINNRFLALSDYIWIIYGFVLFLFLISCFNSIIVSCDLFINRLLNINSESVIGLGDVDEI